MLVRGRARVLLSSLTARAGGQEAPRDGPSLSDGKTLSGRRQLKGTATYAVVDGAIVGTTSKGSPNSFLCSERFFGDFELELEVKLLIHAINSGIQIRSHSYPSY